LCDKNIFHELFEVRASFSTLDRWNLKIAFAVWPTLFHYEDKSFSCLIIISKLMSPHTTFSIIFPFSWFWLIFHEFYFWNFSVTFSPPLSNTIFMIIPPKCTFPSCYVCYLFFTFFFLSFFFISCFFYFKATGQTLASASTNS